MPSRTLVGTTGFDNRVAASQLALVSFAHFVRSVVRPGEVPLALLLYGLTLLRFKSCRLKAFQVRSPFRAPDLKWSS